MITAQQARDLAKSEEEKIAAEVEKHLAYFEPQIKAAAEQKKTEIIIRSGGYEYWLYNRENKDPVVKATVAKLRELDYVVSLFYDERQFVDMGLKISW